MSDDPYESELWDEDRHLRATRPFSPLDPETLRGFTPATQNWMEIVHAVISGRHPDSVSEAEAKRCADELEKMQIGGALVRLVLQGKLKVRWDPDSPSMEWSIRE